MPSVQVASTSAAARLVCLLLAIVCSSSRDHGLRSDCTTLASHHGAAHHKRSLAVVVAGFADVPAWVQRLPPEADVHFYSRQPVTGQSGNVVVPNEGLECLPYLQYILDHYEDLPEQVRPIASRAYGLLGPVPAHAWHSREVPLSGPH